MSIVNLMTGMPKMAMIGGAVGGLSQDPFENPFSAVLGAGIGAMSAMNMVYHKRISPVSKKGSLIEFDYRKTSKLIMDEKSKTQALDNLHVHSQRIAKLEAMVARRTTRYNDEIDYINSTRKSIELSKQKRKEQLIRIVNKNKIADKTHGSKLTAALGAFSVDNIRASVPNNEVALSAIEQAQKNADKIQIKIDSLKEYIDRRKIYEQNIQELAKNRGINPFDIAKLDKSNITEEIASVINDAKKMGTNRLVSVSNPTTETISSTIRKTSVSGNFKTQQRLDAIKKHLIDVMGHSEKSAERKSRMLELGLKGKDFDLVDSSLVIRDTNGSRRMPLTSHTKGITRFSKIDGTFYISSGVNPFGLDMVDKRSSLTSDIAEAIGTNDIDILPKIRFDPEEYIAFFAADKNADAVGLTNDFVRKNLEYIQGEAHLGDVSLEELIKFTDQDFTPHARHESAHSLGYMKAIREKNGQISMVDVQTIGREVNGRPTQSQASLILDMFRNKYGVNPMEAQPVNTIGRYVNPELLDRFHETLGTFPSADRGYDAQLSRGYTTSDHMLMNRYDINEDWAKKLALEFGDQYSIDDGAGLISRSAAAKIQAEGYQTFEIHRSKFTGEYLVNSDIAEILAADKSRRQDLIDKMKIHADTVLGYDKDMNAVKIGNVFTNGRIHSISESDGKLTLRVKSKFDGLNENWIKLFGAGSKGGYTVVPDDVFENMKKLMNVTDDIDMIAGQSETGNKILAKLIDGTAEEKDSALKSLIEQIESSDIKQPYLDNQYFSKHLGILKNTASSSDDIAKSALFMLMQTDFKGNTDLATSIEYATNDASVIHDLKQLTSDGGRIFHAQRDMAQQKLDSIVNSVDIRKMRTLRTAVSTDLGGGLHGVGNVGSMSWIEQAQLRSYGASLDFINAISTPNNDALFELSMIQSSAQKSSSVTEADKIARANDIVGLFDLHPEQRFVAADMYRDRSMSHVLHNLTIPEGYEGIIKSVPIPFVETNRSGIYEQETGDLLKAMDAKRKSLIRMDLEYTAADERKRKVLAPKYIEELSAFEKSIRQSVTGESSIIKEVSKRQMEGSAFLRARSIGGKFAEAMEGEKYPGIVLSQSQAIELAKRAGIEADVSIEAFGDDGYGKLMFHDGKEFRAFNTLTSREPSQGAYSILGTEVYIAPEGMLKDGEVGIANTKHNPFKTGQFTDFDYDMLKVASANFQGGFKDLEEHTAFVKKLMDAQVEAFGDAETMALALSRKGNKASTVMHSSLMSELDYISHQSFSSLKSKQRKFLASHTTDLSMNLTEALSRHLNATVTDPAELMKRSIMGRTLIHNITESLLKSAHRSSLDLQNAAGISEIESLKAAYAKLHNKTGKAGEFEADFKKATTSLFGANMTDDVKAIYDSAMSDVTSAAKAHVEEIEANRGRIQDFRGARTFDQIIEETQKYAKTGELTTRPGEEIPEILDGFRRKASNAFHHIKRNIIANKKPIGLGLAGLAATALVFGGDKPEMTKESLPFETSDGILPPLQSENAQVFKKKSFDNRRSTNIKGSYKEKGASSSRLKRDTFGHKNGRTNITIRDKRDSSY